MTERYLKRRPTWYRFAVIFGFITILAASTHIKRYWTGHGGTVPLWVLLFLAVLFTFAAMSEMSQTVGWNNRSVRIYPRWGFQYLGYKTFEVAIAAITEIGAGYMSNESPGGKPFTTINVADGVTEIPIRTDSFFREDIQQLVADIARLRPDLELSDNLQAYIRGELDGYWPV